jgi:hypothetical protein
MKIYNILENTTLFGKTVLNIFILSYKLKAFLFNGKSGPNLGDELILKI